MEISRRSCRCFVVVRLGLELTVPLLRVGTNVGTWRFGPAFPLRVGQPPPLRIIWVGEVISIGVMELVMNAADYQMGGMGAPSMASRMF